MQTMKTLELNNLPTPVLLVWGLPEDAHDSLMFMGGRILTYDTSVKTVAIRLSRARDEYWQLIGKLSELTEDQAKELVENIEIPFAPDEICYPDYRIYNVTGFGALDTALASFKSSIKSAGYYFQNPMGKRYDPSVCVKYPEYRQEQSFNEYDGELRKAYGKAWSDWQDAQSKTLPENTLIFKRA